MRWNNAKGTWIAGLSMVALISLQDPAGSTDLGLGIQVNEGSSAIDLADVPPGISLLRSAGLMLRDELLTRQLNEEFSTLTERIDQALVSDKYGFLLEVELYLGPNGEPNVPGGQLLYPIGAGREPLDAMAEHLREPSLRAGNPPGPPFQNRSYHIWVTRSDDGLKGHTIPTEFREHLLSEARLEAQRRDRLPHGLIRCRPISCTKSSARSSGPRLLKTI